MLGPKAENDLFIHFLPDKVYKWDNMCIFPALRPAYVISFSTFFLRRENFWRKVFSYPKERSKSCKMVVGAKVL